MTMLLLPKCLWHGLAVLATLFLTTQLWSFSLFVHNDASNANDSRQSIYADRLQDQRPGTIEGARRSIDVLPLLQVLSRYRNEHGAHVLQKEIEHLASSSNTTSFLDRKYLVVYYSCPHAAGNLLHDFYKSTSSRHYTEPNHLVEVQRCRNMRTKYIERYKGGEVSQSQYAG